MISYFSYFDVAATLLTSKQRYVSTRQNDVVCLLGINGNKHVTYLKHNSLTILKYILVCSSWPDRATGTEKVWVEPKILFMWPDKLNTPQLVVCRHDLPQCKFEDCSYRWRAEHNLVKAGNEKYLLVDSDRAVYIKAPISRTKNLGPFACVIELNGKPVGEGIGFIKFLGNNLFYNFVILCENKNELHM